jgi:hypothetical protein
MIKLPAYFTGFSSKSDGSAGLRFATQELTAEDFADLKREHNAFGWLIFSPNEGEEIPDENAEEEGISASERYRRRLFVYWKHPKGKNGEGDFETWRKQHLELMGEKLLERLQ